VGGLGTTVAMCLTKDWTGEISKKHADASQPRAEWACEGGKFTPAFACGVISPMPVSMSETPSSL